MQVWWFVALCACAWLAGGAHADLYSESEAEDLTSVQEEIDMDQDVINDPLLARVRGAGRAAAALCAGAGGARCAGALWARRWLLARASCTRGLTLSEAAVLPLQTLASCENITPESGAIGVLARFEHPLHAPGERAHDAALLLLARAAPAPPAHAAHGNHTHALVLGPELERWLEYIPASLPLARDQRAPPASGPAVLRLPSSPLRLLGAAVLLPAAALLLLFALALRLPSAAAIRYDLLAHEALEHATEPDAADSAPDAPDSTDDAHTSDRLAFL